MASVQEFEACLDNGERAEKGKEGRKGTEEREESNNALGLTDLRGLLYNTDTHLSCI